jgi:hypothetical protein
MTRVPELDPAKYAVVNLHPYARHAHQVAGHAVAVVVRGWRLREVQLGSINFSTDDEAADIPWRLRHTTPYADRPFFIFAGVWASAMWTCQDEDVDYDTAMYVARDDAGAITEEYESRVEEFAARLGFDPNSRPWEMDWCDELEPLWPAVCDVAAMLLDGQPVAHEDVQAAVNRCRK